MWRRIAVALLVLAVPLGALAQDTCTCSTTGNIWSDANFPDAWTCVGGDTVADLDDNFVGADGCGITTNGNLALGTVAGRTITMQSGSTWTWDSSGGGFHIQLPAGDTTFETSSTLVTTPGYKTFGVETPAVRTTYQGANVDWILGDEIVPCGSSTLVGGVREVVEDCEADNDTANDPNTVGDPNHVAVVYHSERWDAGGANDRFACESVGALDPNTDFVVFRNGFEQNYFYQITPTNDAASSATFGSADADCGFFLNILQTDQFRPNTSDYPLARRAFIETDFGASAVAAGTRIFNPPNGVITEAPSINTYASLTATGIKNMHAGKFIYMEEGSTGRFHQRPQIIGYTLHAAAGAETLQLASLGGSLFPYTASQDIIISVPGFQPGDRFHVISMPIVTSSTATEFDSRLVFEGSDTRALTGVVFSQLAEAQFDSDGTYTLRDVFAMDNSGASVTQYMLDFGEAVGTGSVTMDYVSTVGDGVFTATDTVGVHGMRVRLARAVSRNGSCRYNGDDCIYHPGPNSVLEVTDFQCGFFSDAAASATCIDADTTNESDVNMFVVGQGIVCKGCGNTTDVANALGGLIQCNDDNEPNSPSQCNLDDVMEVGNAGRVFGGDKPNGLPNGDDYLSRATSIGTVGELTKSNVVGCMIRDGTAVPGAEYFLNEIATHRNHVLRDCIIWNKSTTGRFAALDPENATRQYDWFNNLWLDNATISDAGSPSMFQFGASFTGGHAGTIDRQTIAFSQTYRDDNATTGWRQILSLLAADSFADLTISNMLYTGMHGDDDSVNSRVWDDSQAEYDAVVGGTWLWWNNRYVSDPNTNIDFRIITPDPNRTIRFQDPELMDPLCNDWRPRPGGLADREGVGIRGGNGGPGIYAEGFTHRVTGLPVENAANLCALQ